MRLTNESGISEFLINGIPPAPEEMTVADLIDSPRIWALKKQNDYTEDIGEDLFDKVMSEAMMEKLFPDQEKKNLLEAAQSLGELRTAIPEEKRIDMQKVSDYLYRVANISPDLYKRKLIRTIEGRILIAHIPYYNFDTETLYSFKYCSAQKYAHQPTKELWALEQNVLAWMLQQSGYEVRAIKQIVHVGNWRNYAEDKKPFGYPPSKFFEADIEMTDSNLLSTYILAQMGRHIEAEKKLPDCTGKERWCTSSMFKVFKPNKKKPERMSRDESIIDAYIKKNDYKHRFRLRKVEVPQRPARCPKCVVNSVCGQYQTEIRKQKP